MLKQDQKIIVRWNPRTKKWYEQKGYKYTKMKDLFEIDISDMQSNSNKKVTVICDYCGDEYSVIYNNYYKTTHNCIVEKDSCKKCTSLKRQESNRITYGVSFVNQIEEVNKKKSDSLRLSTRFIKNELQNHGLILVGEYINNQTPVEVMCEIHQNLGTFKIRYSSLSVGHVKYGCKECRRKATSGLNHPNWNPNITMEDRMSGRSNSEYEKWRYAVYERDKYQCQCCGRKYRIQAHHLNGFAEFTEQRYDINNGIALCFKCHAKFHKIYGLKNVTSEKFSQFILKEQWKDAI